MRKRKPGGKNFNINVKPRDLLVDMKGLSADAGFAFVKFWMHHHLHGEPLPPREERVDDVDEYFRDLLDMKNVKTWRRARDELVAKARIRVTDDGRYFIGRTMRELGDDEEPSNGGEEPSGSEDDGAPTGQTVLPLRRVALPPGDVEPAPSVGKSVDEPVQDAGQASDSSELRAKFGRSSPEVRAKFGRSSGEVACQPIDIAGFRVPPFMFSSSPSLFVHEVVVAESRFSARARGDPWRPLA